MTAVEIALGALLHDIGKLVQRAGESVALPTNRHHVHTHRHALWTDVFFEWMDRKGLDFPEGVSRQRVRDLAVFHHRPATPLQRLIAEADRLAAGQDRTPNDEKAEQAPDARDRFRRVTLRSTPATIDLALGPPRPAFYPALPLDAAALIPRATEEAEAQPARYAALWELFQQGFRALCGNAAARAEVALFEQGLLALSERLLWAVPSSTVDEPDVSLRDHACSVAAIAVALFRHHEARGELGDEAAITDRTREKFRLLEGDLSGIQAALLRLAHQQVRGAARILRARSFLIAATAEAAVLAVRAALDLPACSVVQAAGGHFRILLPELADTGEQIARLQRRLDDDLLARWSGDLAVVLGLGPAFPANELMRGALWRTEAALRQALEAAKEHGFNGRLGIIDLAFGEAGACASCGVRPGTERDPHDPSVSRCGLCDQAHELGARLPRAETVSLLRADAPVQGLAGPLGTRLAVNAWAAHGTELVVQLSGPHGANAFATRYLANHVPLIGNPEDRRYADLSEEARRCEAGDLKTFEHIAADAREVHDDAVVGRAMLAVLKADVDRLGLVFGHGLGADRSPARVAQLSRLIDRFFAEHFPDLLRAHFPNTYTVYAGGDDLLLIGPWREGAALACKLREAFGRFAGDNPNLTLSAGLAFIPAHMPLNRAVEEAEERLEAAKGAGRDRAGLLGTVVEWPRLEKTDALAEALSKHMRAERIGSTQLHAILRLVRMRACAEAGKPDPMAAMWNARWQYQRKRLADRLSETEEPNALLADLDALLPPPGQRPATEAEIALTFALWRNR